MRNAKVLVPIITILVGLGVGFFGGYEYRNYVLNKARGNFGGANGTRFVGARNGQGAPGGAAGFRGGVFGTVLSMDDKSITVKLPDGSSKIVLFTDSTTYSNTVTASKTDVKTGASVAVMGAPNADGSVTATNVQINPEFGRMMPSPTPASK